MTTRRSRTPGHCRHKAKGLGYVRLSGRTFYTGKWGTEEAQREYERLLAEWLRNGRLLPADSVGDSGYWVKDLIADFWVHSQAYYRKDGKPTKEVSNTRYALRPVKALYGDLPAEQFSPTKLKTVRDRMIEHGLCRNVINQRMGIIKRMFRWAAEEEKVPGETAQALLCVRGLQRGRSEARETEPVQPVPEDHVKAILPLVSRQVAAMVQLQWLTGMRPGEVLQMRWGDVDRTGSIWLYRPASHKTQHHGKDRVIPLGPQTQEILKGFPKLDPNASIFSPIDADRELRARKAATRKTKVQPSQVARHRKAMANPRRKLLEAYDLASYRRAIQRACRVASVPQWSPNRLRHSAATRIRREYGLEVARALLGHSSMATTEIYAELDLSQAVRAMERSG